jgi:tRNA dimethylallyltransferase
VALAERYNGEIINADALQMYKGLPIATNKIPLEERRGIPHHLLDCIDLKEEPWTVTRFVTEAKRIVDEIRSRRKLPILVGGTHYYTQALLFRNALSHDTEEHLSTQEMEARWPILGKSGQDMLEELRKVDPEMAARWHPNDERKIRRSLEIWLRTGKKASDVYAEQVRNKLAALSTSAPANASRILSEGYGPVQPPLRYDTLVFWLYDEPDILKQRLDDRVETMVKQGLLAEVSTMDVAYDSLTQAGIVIDITKGIWVAIGFKEFKQYLTALKTRASGREVLEAKQAGIELTKIATRQYAKYQNRWIGSKLLHALQEVHAADSLFLLDRGETSYPVESTAANITCAFLAGRALPDPTSLSPAAERMLNLNRYLAQENDDKCTRHCEMCDVTVTTGKSWEQHLSSRKHKGLLRPPRPWDRRDDIHLNSRTSTETASSSASSKK